MSIQHSQKPNGPFKGRSSFNFEDLQNAVDVGGWKEDPEILSWIWAEYSRLIAERRSPPPDFGSTEFWLAIHGVDVESEPPHPMDEEAGSVSEQPVDFGDLQLAIDSDQWKTDPHLCGWIWEQYSRLITEKKNPPLEFGSIDFWKVILGDDDEPEFDGTWRPSGSTARVHLPFIADTSAGENAHLVPYSDSDDEDPEGDQQQLGGHDSAPPPPQQNQQACIALPLDQYFELSDPDRRFIRKFRVWSDCYTLRFRNQQHMHDLNQILLGIFRKVLETVFADGHPEDRVGLEISHPNLRKVFHVPMQPQNQLTADRILTVIEAIIHSEEEFNVDEDLQIVFVRVRRPRGGVRREPRWNHKEWMRKHGGPHGGCFIQIKNTEDNLCLPRALVVAKARIDREEDPIIAQQWDTIRKNRSDRPNKNTLQKRLALNLIREAGLEGHEGECGEEEIRKLQGVLEPHYQIKIFSAACCNFLTFKGEVESEKVLHIYHDNADEDEEGNRGHFLVCTKPHVLFNRQHWCDICNKGFNDKMRHKCIGKCYSCFSLKACELTRWWFCPDCNRWFRNRECFDKHKTVAQPRRNGSGDEKRQKKNESVCDKIKRCKECDRVLNWTRLRVINGIRVHKCGEMYCIICEEWAPVDDHLCFMHPPKERKKKRVTNNKKKRQGQAQQRQRNCALLESEADEGDLLEDEGFEDPDCLDAIVRNHERAQMAQEDDNGPPESLSDVLEQLDLRENEDPSSDPVTETQERSTKIFFDFECTQEKEVGVNKVGPIYEHMPILCVALKVCTLCQDKVMLGEYGSCNFCGQNQWVFEGDNCRDDFCKWFYMEEHSGVTGIAHNAKGYDSQFLIQYLVSQTRTPKVISKGRELMMVEYDGIKVIDSMNFMPMALSELPKAFDQAELKKGFFPFKFCTRKNLGLEKLGKPQDPPPESYVGQWPSAWYYDPGNMKEKKRNDFYSWYVKQLGKQFDLKKELLDYCKSDVDILMKCCMKFEDLFHQVTGVKPFDVAVTIASACMHVFRKNFMKPYSIAIVPHGGYRRKANQSVFALKWLKWVSEQEGIYIQHARNAGEKKVGSYKVDGFDGEQIYEFHGCVWHGCPRCFRDREKKVPGSNLTMDDVYSQTLSKTAFLRTEGYTVVEMWECDLRRELRRNPAMKRFFDSLEIAEPLEPRDALRGGRTNATRLYFRCGPDQKLSHIDICSLYPWGVKWTIFPKGHPKIITENFEPITKDHQPYFGLIKCRVQPPTRLLHPVLPYKTAGKLMFPLCRTCAENQFNGYCEHSERQRSICGTWVSTELDKALQLGYEVEHVDEIWHYDQVEIHDGADPDTGLFTKYINCFLKLKIEASGWPKWVKTEEDKKKFLDDCLEKEGIVLDPAKIDKNPGLRSLAKLMLNSFWGKFGQRTNMAKDVFVSDPTKFGDLLFDDTNVVERVRIMSEEMVYVSYRKEEEFAEVMVSTNPVIAAFTTANCRLKLYAYLEKLQDRVCYFDTDSVIYVTAPGDTYEPSLGSFLGDMTDELEEYGDGAYIVEFVSGGPKNYAYRIQKADGKTVSKVKIRGFTLNYHTAAHLNRRTLRKRVVDFVRGRPVQQPWSNPESREPITGL